MSAARPPEGAQPPPLAEGGGEARSAQPGGGSPVPHQAVLPEGWPRPKGYANGVVATGRLLFIAGMVGWDAQGRFPGDDFAAQARQALQNVAEVLRAAGGSGEHVVRMTWYVTDKREYLAATREIGQAFRETIGNYAIAMTAVEVRALIEDRAKVEIEATAVLPEL